ncbi:fluoride efflux transporter CrcB [Naasia aerilata]|uniref:Fluoride-specific ion channel FluC n=1 Tax=Naasia aerilata TaxID=1162966 RepID=A0ABN6XM43_9MICO|nr:fluoride efflux transporter CrcB [Naasia aerilata]BDZ46032.1 hypothetical protein GCM10025866_19410 [Naasia aerilata]
MTPLLLLALSVAGGAGAATRFLLDGLIRARTTGRYPVGTTVINLSGSLLLGLLAGLTTASVLPEAWQAVVGTGFLGGYTTFSTASFETVRLLQSRRYVAALLNGLGMLVFGVAAAAAGFALGAAL